MSTLKIGDRVLYVGEGAIKPEDTGTVTRIDRHGYVSYKRDLSGDAQYVRRCDLELVESTKPETPRGQTKPETKDTNPKDALGSTRAPIYPPLPAMTAMMLALAEGAVKYGWWNWTSAGVRASIYVAAAARHLFKWFFGQDKDPVTGVHHLGYVMACCAILIDAEWRAKLVDDRPPALPRMDELFAQTETILKNLAATMKPQPGVRDYTNPNPEGVPRTP